MATEMSPDGTKWVHSVPKSWRVEPLKYHCSMFKGLLILKTDLVEEGVPVISYGQIHSKDNAGTHLGDSLLRFIPAARVSGNESSKLQRGDVVFADTSEDVEGIGNAALIDTDDVVYAGYHTVTCRPNQTSLSGRYLAYLARTDAWRYQLRNLAMGVKVFSVTQTILRKSEVLLPPRDEQERIADFLDDRCVEIDAAAELIRRQIASLECYRRSRIHEAVTKGLDPSVSMKPSGVEWMGDIPSEWSITKLKYIARTCNGLDYDSEDVCSPDDSGATLVVRSSNISNGEMIHADDVFVNTKIPDSVQLRKDDLVIVRANGSPALVGKSALFSLDGSCVAGGFMLICRSEDNRFLRWVLQSNLLPYYRGTFDTTTINRLSATMLGNMLIPWPSKEERKQIAKNLSRATESIDAVIDTKRRQFDVLKKRRQSLIYEYVTGKRRVGSKG